MTISNNFMGGNQGQAVTVSPVDAFIKEVQLENLHLKRILRFVNQHITFYQDPDDHDAILLATLIKQNTSITRVEIISAIKYLAFYRIAQNSFLMGQSLWSAVINHDNSHYWVSYL